MRIVLDTNCFLVIIGRKSKYRKIFDALIQGKITLLISNEILYEYEEKLQIKTNSIVTENLISFLKISPYVEAIEVYFKWNFITKDVDDNKFVDCALNGNADFLITNDKHFNVLKTLGFPPVSVKTINDFMKII